MNRVMVDFSSLALHLFNTLTHDGKAIKLGAKILRHRNMTLTVKLGLSRTVLSFEIMNG